MEEQAAGRRRRRHPRQPTGRAAPQDGRTRLGQVLISGASDPAVARALDALARGDRSVEIGLMWLLLAARTAEEAAGALERALAGASGRGAERLAEARDLLAARPAAFATVQAVAAAVDHDGAAPSAVMLARLSAQFDRAAAVSPDAAAALYSLGDPGLLEPVTAEVIAWMRAKELWRDRSVLLDVGCGPGRFLAGLAPTAKAALGLELSEGMAREAARRLASTPQAGVARVSGRDLACVADGSVDLVLFADSFPYIVQAGGGLAEAHLAESARVLRPGGRLLILNWAYRDAPADHACEAEALAQAAGLDPMTLGATPFVRWDAAAYMFRRVHDGLGVA